MENSQKMALAGSALVVAGMGLGIVGIVLIIPAVFQWTVKLVEKGANSLAPNSTMHPRRLARWSAPCIDLSTRRRKLELRRSGMHAPTEPKVNRVG
jgi:hypothetical protein